MKKVRIKLVCRAFGQEVYHLSISGAISKWQAVIGQRDDRWKILADAHRIYAGSEPDRPAQAY